MLATAAKALPQGHPLRFVQIGSIGGADIALPGAALRASAITLMGSGIGSVPLPRLLGAVRAVFDVAVQADLHIATRTIPIDDIVRHWNDDGGIRTVFRMG